MTEEENKPRVGRPPGFQGTVNRTIKYECSTCGADVGREGLRIKRVNYGTMGRHNKILRSRTVAWLCVPCMEAEPEYNRESLMGSPGMKDVVDGSEG